MLIYKFFTTFQKCRTLTVNNWNRVKSTQKTSESPTLISNRKKRAESESTFGFKELQFYSSFNITNKVEFFSRKSFFTVKLG